MKKMLEAILKELQGLDWKAKNIKALVLKVIVKAINETKDEPQATKKKATVKKDNTKYALIINGANIKELKLSNVQNKMAHNLFNSGTYKLSPKDTQKKIDDKIKELNKNTIDDIMINSKTKIVVVK